MLERVRAVCQKNEVFLTNAFDARPMRHAGPLVPVKGIEPSTFALRIKFNSRKILILLNKILNL